MLNNTKQRMIQDATKHRDDAINLLRSLIDAKSVSERNLADIHQPDLVKQVTGKSSMDTAIASTRRLIESFNRVLEDLRRNLTTEDLQLIGSIEANIAAV